MIGWKEEIVLYYSAILIPRLPCQYHQYPLMIPNQSSVNKVYCRQTTCIFVAEIIERVQRTVCLPDEEKETKVSQNTKQYLKIHCFGAEWKRYSARQINLRTLLMSMFIGQLISSSN